MTKSVKKSILNRLNYAIGHLEGIKKMVQDEAYCMSIIQQTRAVNSLLGSVDSLLLSDHLNHCVREVMSTNSRRAINKATSELVEIYKHA